MAVLELLRSHAQPLGVAEVAQHVGLHQNTVRSHLDLLVDAGYAIRRSEAPSGPGRPRVVYQATAAPEGERNYQLLAEVLAANLVSTTPRPGEAAVNAGRAWAGSAGRQRHGGDARTAGLPPVSEEAAIAEVVRMLGDIGFAPEVSADGTSIYLTMAAVFIAQATNTSMFSFHSWTSSSSKTCRLLTPDPVISRTNCKPSVQYNIWVSGLSLRSCAVR